MGVPEEEAPARRKRAEKRRRDAEPVDEEDEYDEESSLYSNSGSASGVPKRPEPVRPVEAYKDNVRVLNVAKNGKGGNSEVVMIMPRSFDDVTTIADLLLSYKAVVLNMEGIDLAAAQRLIDFASGACYTVGGNLQKISKKIFMIVPQNMNLSGDFDELVGDMVDLNSMNGAR